MERAHKAAREGIMFWKNHYGIVFAAAVVLTGCRGEVEGTRAEVAAGSPAVSVAALTQKPPGDSGKPLIHASWSEEDDADNSPAVVVPAPAPQHIPQYVPIERLTPVSASPGIVVCEPVADSAALAAFGAGCGRWLHLTVGGQAEIGQTPTLSALTRAQAEMERTDLRLTPSEADRLYSILGATHAAAGRLTGTAAHSTLTYQLYALPGYRAVSPPISVSGTEVQIVAHLPAVARALSARLGVARPRIPAAVAASPSDLALLGTLPWSPDDTATPAQIQRLQALAPRVPLAATLLYGVWAPGRSETQEARDTQALLTQSPDNPLVWSLVAYDDPARIVPHQVQLSRNLQRFPRSYLFSASQTWLQRRLGHSGPELQWAERTVQYAPHSPEAWLTLGSTVSRAGARLRKSRVASEMTSAEWAFLNSVYPQWLSAVLRAARLDPKYGLAWDRVAVAATFAGNMPLADNALQQSIRLQPDDPAAYDWGLQMYQPKWSDAGDKLNQTVEALAVHPFSTVTKEVEAASLLKDNEPTPNAYRAQIHARCAAILGKTQKALARNPGDAQMRYNQAWALDQSGRKSDAATEYKNVLLLRPSDYASHRRLGEIYAERHQAAAAEAEITQALRLSPGDGGLHYELAQIYHEEQRGPETTRELQAAVKSQPSLLAAYQQLCVLLDEQGRHDESIAAGAHALRLAPNDYLTLDNIADNYLHKRRWATSIRASEAALRVNPQDGLAHLNLGEAYIGKGDRTRARAEWRQTLTLDRGAFAQDAQAELTKYP